SDPAGRATAPHGAGCPGPTPGGGAPGRATSPRCAARNLSGSGAFDRSGSGSGAAGRSCRPAGASDRATSRAA
ncbi:MAG: hypothetical protein Q8R85_10140, partial [Bosea sp. (in: a-proteobacteria)]|uniref:hypothetical protein n=1 Tax=Bosea sp. (in: a-proteobacteria) TaxID=1871050 RepID=UPI002733954C